MDIRNLFTNLRDMFTMNAEQRREREAQLQLEAAQLQLEEQRLNTLTQFMSSFALPKEADTKLSGMDILACDYEILDQSQSLTENPDPKKLLATRVYMHDRIIREIIIPKIKSNQESVRHSEKSICEKGHGASNDYMNTGQDIKAAAIGGSAHMVSNSLSKGRKMAKKHDESVEHERRWISSLERDTKFYSAMAVSLAWDAHHFLQDELPELMKEINSWPEQERNDLLEKLGQEQRFKDVTALASELSGTDYNLPDMPGGWHRGLYGTYCIRDFLKEVTEEDGYGFLSLDFPSGIKYSFKDAVEYKNPFAIHLLERLQAFVEAEHTSQVDRFYDRVSRLEIA